MFEKTAIVRNEHGIHCRPSAVIVKAAHDFPGTIRVVAGSGEANLKSLLALVSLGLACGTAVRIRVSGPDEETWCNRMAQLFETHFDFPQA
jgi:phosphocarrier protein HPr